MYQQSAQTNMATFHIQRMCHSCWESRTLSQVVKFRTAQLDAVSIGQQAPDIVGEDLQGQKRSLSDYQGKIVVLHFWATWCGPCVEKLPHLQRRVSEHETQPFPCRRQLDRDREAARKFVSERGLSWPSSSH